MGFGLLILGSIFFANPCLNVLDILPDWIGCLLIFLGLRKLSDLSPRLAGARAGFGKMSVVFLLKFASFFLLLSVPESESVWRLIASFVFAIFEIVFLLPAFSSLFEGISYLGIRFPAEELDKNRANVSSFTSVFLVARIVLNLLPELTYLWSDDYSGVVTAWQTESSGSYRSMLTVVNLFFVSVLGLVFLALILPYFGSIRKNKVWIKSLEETWQNEIASDGRRMTGRFFKTPILLLLIGAFFLPAFPLEGVNILPEFLFPALSFFALLILKKREPYAKKILPVAAASFVLSGVFWGLSLRYALEYYYANIVRTPKAYYAFLPVAISSFLSSAGIAVLLILLFGLIEKIVEEHTGNEQTDPVLARLDNTRSSLRKMNRTALVFGLISCVTHAFCSGYAASPKTTFFLKISQFQFVDLILSLFFLFFAFRLLAVLREKIERKYL